MIEGARQHSLSVSGLQFSACEMGTGPLVVCIHGFPDTPATFRYMLPALAQAGFRAAAVTLRGYEASSQPSDGDYSLAALAGDVEGWIDALGADKAHLIGHDWGANLAYAAAGRCPARINRLVTMAVPHPSAFAVSLLSDYEQMRRSWYVYLFQLRGTAEAIAAASDFALLKRLWGDWSPGWDASSDWPAVPRAFAQTGVLSAALEYYRTAFNAAHSRAGESQALLAAPIAAPTLGLCGADDGCISARVFEQAMPPTLFAGGVKTAVIPGAGHFAHLEQPERVHRAILDHFA